MTIDPQIPVAARLAALAPSAVDRRLVSSAQQCGVELREAYEPRYQSVVMKVTAQSREALQKARARFANAMTAPTMDQLEAWLAELSVITARRQDDDQTESLRFSAYASRLSDYPADVVHHALLGKHWKFFPVWSDLADACEDAVRQRRRMQRALDQEEQRMREDQLRKRELPDEKAVTLTPEEVAARKAETDQMLASLLGSLKAKSAQQDADTAARAQSAADSYQRFRQSPAEDQPTKEAGQ